MFSQMLFGVEWKSVLSHLTGGSLREKALTWRSSGVAECFITFDCARSHLRSSGVAECCVTLDCARRHLAIVGSG